MTWNATEIGEICLGTRMRDPRRNPNKPFLYVDISAIDRNLKVITSAPEIPGAEAPSRARKEIRENDVLVSTVRPNLNAVAIVPQELDGQIASTGFCVLRPNPSAVDGKYLFYFAITSDFIGTLSNQVRGAHYPAVSDGDVKRIRFPLPPLKEQGRIVEILDQADALRRKRIEADAKAASILPAFFYKMFGDPATNPKSWPTDSLAKLANVQGGFAFKSADFTERGVLLVRIGNLTDGEVLYDNKSAFLPKELLDGYESYLLLQNDLLIALTGATTGKVARFYLNLPALLNQRVGRFISIGEKRATLDYLHLLMQTDFAQNYIWKYARGFGQPNIAPKQIKSMIIPIPPENLILQFSKLIQSRLRQKIIHNASSRNIEKIFFILLHRAFTGDLTAKWREAHMKELIAEMEAQTKALGLSTHRMEL